jgi:putative DNA-invertase from lambdoid prophage Rac
VERVHAGLKRARSQGKKLGRPKAIVDPQQVAALRRQGLTLAELAARLRTSEATVCRISKSLR